MSSQKGQWITSVLVGVVAVLATIVCMTVFGGYVGSIAEAQPMEGSADYVVGILGSARESRLPLFLIDSKAQKIMIYEYDQGRRALYLRYVRSFRYDRELEDASYGEQNTNERPSVQDIRNIVAPTRR